MVRYVGFFTIFDSVIVLYRRRGVCARKKREGVSFCACIAKSAS
jgi:hypothetical protein